MKKVTVSDVLQVINKAGIQTVTKADMDADLSAFGMDSIRFINMIIALEDAFDCEIPDSKLLIQQMDTVNKIMTILQDLYDAEYED